MRLNLKPSTPRRATLDRLEKDFTAADGLVTVGRIVEPDGHFLPVDPYRSDGGGFVIVREMGEPYDAFERRVIEEFHWRALQDGRAVQLFPMGA